MLALPGLVHKVLDHVEGDAGGLPEGGYQVGELRQWLVCLASEYIWGKKLEKKPSLTKLNQN